MKKRHASVIFAILLTIGISYAQDPSGETKAVKENKRTIGIIGSSVAAGWVTSLETQYDMQNGWVNHLIRLLEPQGWTVIPANMPGDNCEAVLKRIDTDLFTHQPDFVIIGLSMGNEGLGDVAPETVATVYESGLMQIVQSCRDHGALPIVGLCYVNDGYDVDDYEYLKKMNRKINSWNLPCINFLGALNDGNGHFPEGTTFEGDHPNNLGHEALFYALVPTLFDALAAGKPIPKRIQSTECLEITAESVEHALCYVPDQVMYAYSFGFSFRCRFQGTLAGIVNEASAGRIGINEIGKLVLNTVVASPNVLDGNWHDVFITGGTVQGETCLYLDGSLEGTVHEKGAPLQFILGTTPELGGNLPSDGLDLKDAFIYRGALTPEEVMFLHEGGLLQASLEIYSSLTDPTAPKTGIVNLAQSMSQWVDYRSTQRETKVSALTAKLKAVQEANSTAKKFKDKSPIEMNPSAFDSFTGIYEIGPGDQLQVSREGDDLYLIDRQMKARIWPESKTKFFVKHPMEITVTFMLNPEGRAESLVFQVQDQKIQAMRKP